MTGKYRIVDGTDETFPYSLLDENDTVIRIAEMPWILSHYAFEHLEAREVRHEEDLNLVDRRQRDAFLKSISGT